MFIIISFVMGQVAFYNNIFRVISLSLSVSLSLLKIQICICLTLSSLNVAKFQTEIVSCFVIKMYAICNYFYSCLTY